MTQYSELPADNTTPTDPTATVLVHGAGGFSRTLLSSIGGGGGGVPLGSAVMFGPGNAAPILHIGNEEYLKGGNLLVNEEVNYPDVYAGFGKNYSIGDIYTNRPTAYSVGYSASFKINGRLYILAEYGSNYPTAEPQMYVSDDGGFWTRVTLPTGIGPGASVFDFCYGNGAFHLSTLNGIFKSVDLKTWTLVSAYIVGRQLLRFIGGVFVSVQKFTTTAIYFTSPDCVTWTQRSFPANRNVNRLKVTNGVMFILCSSNTFHTTTDGITLTSPTSPLNAGSGFSDVAYNGTVYLVGAGSYGVIRSTDLITWTLPTTQVSSASYFSGVVAVGTSFVFVTHYYSHTSTDGGLTWPAAITVQTTYKFSSPNEINGTVVAVGGDIGMANNISLMWVSRDAGLTWNDQQSSPTDKFGRQSPIRYVKHQGGLLSFCYNGAWWSGDGGVTWAKRSSVIFNGWASALSDDVAIATSSTTVYRTADKGVTWTTAVINPSYPSRLLFSTKDITLAMVSSQSEVYSTVDGKTWIKGGVLTGYDCSFVEFKGAIYAIYKTANSAGDVFIAKYNPQTRDFSGATSQKIIPTSGSIVPATGVLGFSCGDYLIAAITGGGAALSSNNYCSKDGVTWTPMSLGGYIAAIIYTDGLYIALTNIGIHVSTDMISWIDYQLNNVGVSAAGNNQLTVVGNSVILTPMAQAAGFIDKLNRAVGISFPYTEGEATQYMRIK